MGARACQEAGATLDVDCYNTGAVMGFLELFRSGGKILSSFLTLRKLIVEWKPDVLVLVDYPDFNLRLAKVAKRHGIKVLYFIPPKVWAWRSGRVRKIRQVIDRIAAIFPFESEFYRKHGYDRVTYVGHPLAERLVDLSTPVTRQDSLLLLPGSRRLEVERLLVPMLQGYELLKKEFPHLTPTVVLAPNIDPQWVRGLIGDRVAQDTLDAVTWSQGDALLEMARARAGVLKSGTCNLEGALAGLPFVCVYSGTRIAKFIVDTFVSLKEYSPVNIIRAATVAELMKVQLSPEHIARELRAIISDGPKRSAMLTNLRAVREALERSDSQSGDGTNGATVSERVARCVAELAAVTDAGRGKVKPGE